MKIFAHARTGIPHLIIPLCALLATLALGITPYGTPFRTLFSYGKGERTAPIVIEGMDHAKIAVQVATKHIATAIILTLEGDAQESVGLTVPSDWHLEEVRGVRAKGIASDMVDDRTTYTLSILSFKLFSSPIDSASSTSPPCHPERSSECEARGTKTKDGGLSAQHDTMRTTTIELRFTTHTRFNVIAFAHDSPTPALFSLTDVRIADVDNETTYHKTVQLVEDTWLFAL